ncbi:MAG TPA: hypothetical protein VLX92_31510 [Kofleriaceae bacterium]|nr:hypothetical protein [Kofleriaceae bacterium]
MALERGPLRVASPGHAVFAAVLIALGVVGLLEGTFMPVWAPVGRDVPGREVLIYLSAAVSLTSGAGLLVRRAAYPAARQLLACLVLWLLAFRVPPIVHAPATILTWDGAAETTAIVAGAWVLYAWFAGDRARRVLAGEVGIAIARGLYGLALVPFGLAHLGYIDQTAPLVPGWIPWHVAWAYITGIAFLAAGAAVLTGVCARLAAALSALQIGLFTLLVWIPVVAAGGARPDQWSELGISAAITAAAWLVADSYRVTR